MNYDGPRQPLQYLHYIDENGDLITIPYYHGESVRVKPKTERKSVGRENIELKSQIIQLQTKVAELKQKLAAAEATPSYFAGKNRSMAEI